MQEDMTIGASDVGKVEDVLTPEAPSLDALKGLMQVAIADGDDKAVVTIGKQIVKFKSEIEKAEAVRAQAEAVAMAGDRQKLASKLLKAAKGLAGIDELVAVKAKGFTFHLPDETSDIATVALLVPTVRKTGGGGGGSTGALKEQTGLSRHELIDKYATSAEKAEVQKAFETATSRPDSARYSAEKPVIKRILADNPQLIKR